MNSPAEDLSGKKTILIVEDNELNLKLFSDILDAHGFDVIGVRGGENIIQEVKSGNPDLIIMDIQLPNISGIDLIKEIKQDKGFTEIPIIAVTAYAMQEDEDRILQAGCENYLSKPIDIDSFVEMVGKYVGSE